MDFKVIESTPETLEELYKNSAFTFEGLAREDFGELVNYLKDYYKPELTNVDVYNTSGKLMNDYYHLTGSNAYQDDLNIVSLKLDIFNDIGKITILKLRLGARWFDDIVDNNARREACN